jgi:hypothetical protein
MLPSYPLYGTASWVRERIVLQTMKLYPENEQYHRYFSKYIHVQRAIQSATASL